LPEWLTSIGIDLKKDVIEKVIRNPSFEEPGLGEAIKESMMRYSESQSETRKLQISSLSLYYSFGC